MNIEITKREAQEIMYWVNGRIPQCEHVLTSWYRNDFFKDKSDAEYNAIVKERQDELQMLRELGRKVEVLA